MLSYQGNIAFELYFMIAFIAAFYFCIIIINTKIGRNAMEKPVPAMIGIGGICFRKYLLPKTIIHREPYYEHIPFKPHPEYVVLAIIIGRKRAGYEWCAAIVIAYN